MRRTVWGRVHGWKVIDWGVGFGVCVWLEGGPFGSGVCLGPRTSVGR